jgi:hypothetical protein
MSLAGDVGEARLTLGIERVELLLEPIFGRLAGVDRATRAPRGAGFDLALFRAITRLSARVGCCGVTKPKKRGPDQCVPVKALAISVSDV